MRLLPFLMLFALPCLGLRLISTSPQNTEWLFQIGQGEKLVATSSFSDYPAEASQLPTLGPLFMPALERTVRLRPDIALIDRFTTPLSYEQGLASVGIETIAVAFPTLESLYATSESFLKRVDPPALEKLASFRRCEHAIRKSVKSQFTFLAFTWTEPPILFGHTTLMSDVLTLGGGKNIVPDSRTNPYPQVSEEWLLRHRPDRIYFVSYSASTNTPFLRDFDRWWPGSRSIALPSVHFGRPTFSPLVALTRFLDPPYALKECDAP